MQCKQEYWVAIHPLCYPCAIGRVKEPEYKKKHFWREAKRFSYHSLLYVPICIWICFYFGFWYEMSFILGGIYMQGLPGIRDWLMSKF